MTREAVPTHTLLAVEAATDVCSVAVCSGGQVFARHVEAPRRHAALVLEFCDEVLGQANVSLADLDALVVGRGPGSFTGVRIAVAVVQGLAFGAGLSIAPVSTLATLAQGVYREQGAAKVCAALDARMDETYCGVFSVNAAGLMVPVADEQVCPMSALQLPDGRWHGAGPAWQRYADEIPVGVAERIDEIWPHAAPNARDALVLGAAMVESGSLVSAAALEPVYLRNRVTR